MLEEIEQVGVGADGAQRELPLFQHDGGARLARASWCPEHAPVLSLVVTTVERQLDPSRSEHRAGDEPGDPDQAARTQVGKLPAAGSGGVEEVLLDLHPLAHRHDLDPGPLGEQGQVLPCNIKHVAKGCRVGAEIADEAQVPW